MGSLAGDARLLEECKAGGDVGRADGSVAFVPSGDGAAPVWGRVRVAVRGSDRRRKASNSDRGSWRTNCGDLAAIACIGTGIWLHDGSAARAEEEPVG